MPEIVEEQPLGRFDWIRLGGCSKSFELTNQLLIGSNW